MAQEPNHTIVIYACRCSIWCTGTTLLTSNSTSILLPQYIIITHCRKTLLGHLEGFVIHNNIRRTSTMIGQHEAWCFSDLMNNNADKNTSIHNIRSVRVTQSLQFIVCRKLRKQEWYVLHVTQRYAASFPAATYIHFHGCLVY